MKAIISVTEHQKIEKKSEILKQGGDKMIQNIMKW